MAKNNLETMRHSCSHILAAAVLQLYPATKLGIGPAIENGFYYDFEFPASPAGRPNPINEADLEKITKEMKKIIDEKHSFEREEVSIVEAKKIFQNQPYKLELISDLAKEKKVSIYKTGNFVDLCAGPHVANTSEIGPFKLLSLAGAYWRGSEKNPMLTRIYGTCFPNQKELNEHLWQLEEATKRDHRKIGKELELFTFSDEVGPGLPLWLPKGTIIREELEKWAKATEEKWGYQRVSTPHLTRSKLYEISGHLPYYTEEMYSPIDIEGEKYYLKPMNCPHHHMIYKAKTRSYRDLPIRLAEYGQVYRFERSGVLHGLFRVRGFCQNDAHIYVQEEKAVEEFSNVLKLHQYYYKKLNIKSFKVKLGLPDPKNRKKKYHGDNKMWEKAETMTRQALKQAKIPYTEDIGGAAHYGPKGDIVVESAIGKEYAIGTVQIDPYMPQRFNLAYVDKDGKEKLVVLIHRAPLGSHERFIGFLIEHYGGAFPVWLAPVQVVVITITDQQNKYSQKIVEGFQGAGLRVDSNNRHETISAKIRDAELQKVPYMVIVGEKEVKARNISVRARGERNLGPMMLEEFLIKIKSEIESKS